MGASGLRDTPAGSSFHSSLLVHRKLRFLRPHIAKKLRRWAKFFSNMGASGLEPPKTEVGGFTVPCNCRYATPPEKECWRKELNPQPSDYKSGALPIELHQHRKTERITKLSFSLQAFLQKKARFRKLPE